MKLNKQVIGLFFFIWMTLNFAVGLYIPLQQYIVSLPYLLIIQIINIGIAYDVVLLLCATFTRGGDPPHLDRLNRSPRAALLYLTCNDAMPEALSRLDNQTYKNLTIFVLDDSTDERYQALVDSYGYETVRRQHRRGAKAGNLNHWLSLYGDQFEYFVVLDNDGILKNTFIENMLKYAEHPDNAQVAIFQSLKKAWNTGRIFPRLLDALYPLQNLIDLRVFNQSDSILSAGCNILCRVRPYEAIGGFDENFATEDFATNLRLIECGYQGKAVNVVSYVAASETARFHAVRMTRWASGTLETAISKSWEVPLVTKLRMFMGVHSYSQWGFYILGMLLVIWGYRMTWQQLYIISFLAFRRHRPDFVLFPFAIILLYILYGVLVRPLWVIRLSRISWRDYWGYSLLNTALSFYTVFYVVIGQIESLLGKKARFTIGEKRWFKSSLWDIVKGMRWTVLLILILIIGLARNPVARIVHSVWYILLFLSPLIIYWLQNNQTEHNTGQFRPESLSSTYDSLNNEVLTQ